MKVKATTKDRWSYRVRTNHPGDRRVIIQARGYRDAIRIKKRLGGRIQ